jgi:hypothetical protein
MQQSRAQGYRWNEQCAAAKRIEERFGVESALEYLVGEKFFAFVALAERDPASKSVMHSFAAEIKGCFPAPALREYLDRLPRNPRFRPPREHTEDLSRYAHVRRLLEC